MSKEKEENRFLFLKQFSIVKNAGQKFLGLKNIKTPEIQIKPFDLILFRGDDFVGRMISKIQIKHVEEHEKKKGGKLWTHVGVVVDKSILPLDCLEDDKLYIYESILSGTVLGVYTYTRVMSVDHPLENIEKNCHSGPQLRPLYETCEEAKGEIAIARMTDVERKRLYANGIENIQKTLVEFHEKYKEYGYPFNMFTQMAAASNGIYRFKMWVKRIIKKCKSKKEEDKSKPHNKDVFCSQFAAALYASVDVTGFVHEEAGKYTPIELDAMQCFEKDSYYIKHNSQFFLCPDGK
jgi:hypothetical protein